MKGILRKIAKSGSFGIVKVNGKDILVRFFKHEGEVGMAFYMPQEETEEGIVFSAEIYRAVGKEDELEKVVNDLQEHMLSLVK